MRHLFIVNPTCAKVKNNVSSIVREIDSYMHAKQQLKYNIHVTRWHRDALGFCRKYVLQAGGEAVRVHMFGGSGTLFEIVNAVIDLPQAQIAAYPMGKANIFLHYFGSENAPIHTSIERQLAGGVKRIDAIRCNQNYAISNVLTGFEALADHRGDRLIAATQLPNDLCYITAGLFSLLSKKFWGQYFSVSLDGRQLDGRYMSIMTANQPWYSQNLCPGIDAIPDDGVFDVYMIKEPTRYSQNLALLSYIHGNYRKYPGRISHFTGRKLQLSSNRMMRVSVDGESFYGNNMEYELIPGAVYFVSPERNGGAK